jgi:hypothetical protein
MKPSSIKRELGKNAPLIAMQLDDSDQHDHACFADSTDVFGIT